MVSRKFLHFRNLQILGFRMVPSTSHEIYPRPGHSLVSEVRRAGSFTFIILASFEHRRALHQPSPALPHSHYSLTLSFSLLLALTITRFTISIQRRRHRRPPKSLRQVRRRERLRPYHVENTPSRPIWQVKQRWARLVLGSETAWESRVP